MIIVDRRSAGEPRFMWGEGSAVANDAGAGITSGGFVVGLLRQPCDASKRSISSYSSRSSSS